jgi:hypothetical protein
MKVSRNGRFSSAGAKVIWRLYGFLSASSEVVEPFSPVYTQLPSTAHPAEVPPILVLETLL